jgi:hypothetical protein
MSESANKHGYAYGWSLHSEVGKEDTLGTLPLFLRRRQLSWLQFPPAEEWDHVDDDPW